MKRIAALLLITILAGACSTRPSDAQDASVENAVGPTIEELLKEVQLALVEVQQNSDVEEYLPGLSSVKLDLNGSFDKNGKLKINLYVFKAGGGITSTEATKLSLTLKPPVVDDAATEISATDLSDQLAQLIIGAAEGVALAVEGEPPLVAKGLTLSVSFGIKKDGEVGAEFTITPIGFELGGGVSSSQVQTITLQFE